MAKIKTKAVQIDTVQLRKNWQDLLNATREEAAKLAAESLQAIIDGLNASSTNRLTQIPLGQDASRGTRNNPLAGAKVVTLIKRDVHDTRNHRVIVYVQHNSPDGVSIFNVLDSGRKANVVKAGFVFPAYRGHKTTPNMRTLDVGDPAVAKSIFKNPVRLQKGKNGKVVMIYMRAGTPLGSITARHFYEAVAEWVEGELLSRQIVDKSRRTHLKLKKGDVIVSVPDRPRFTGI